MKRSTERRKKLKKGNGRRMGVLELRGMKRKGRNMLYICRKGD